MDDVTTSRPDVSAIIPSYDRPQRTKRAIESVANQTYESIELIVVDDGSEPPLRETLSLNNPVSNFHIIEHETNKGANVARNTGIKSASGKYLAFLDSDDEWLPNKIERQVAKIQSSNTDIVYTAIQQVDEKGDLITVRETDKERISQSDLLNENIVGSYSSIMVSNSIIDQVGYPNPELPCWQDWEWYLRLSDVSDFVSISDPLVIRHNEGSQISDNFQYRLEAFDSLRQRLQERASTKLQAEKSEAYLHFRIGYSALSSHMYSTARSQFVRSIKLYPKEKKFYVYLIVSSPIYPTVRRFKRMLAQRLYGDNEHN